MLPYRHAVNIKTGLFIIGIGLIIGLLAYTQVLVNKLRNDNKEIVHLYANMIVDIIADDNDANIDFVFENVIQKAKFPLIQTNTEKVPQIWKNIPESVSTLDQISSYIKIIEKNNKPLTLKYNVREGDEIIFGFLYYGDSLIVQKLKLWRYIEIFAIGLFIFLGFSGFSFIRNNEKKHIWVGMARETAHQLGTPVSALIGWVDRLGDHPNEVNTIIPEMKMDLKRLEQIGRRFSKMGTSSDFERLNLSERVERVVEYLNKRLPSIGKKVNIIKDIEQGIFIKANGSLLAWAMENIIRNGMDAIDRENGEIIVALRKVENKIKIRIQDNGKGIPKKDWKNIFRPGFSTKKAGWGLGLSLANRIIEDIHEGELKIIQSTFHAGTIVEICL